MFKFLSLLATVIIIIFLYKIYSPGTVTKVIQSNHKQAVIYYKPGCGFCIKAKTLLEAKKITYQEVDLSNNREIQQKLQKETGQYTVPYIFINEKFVGGFQDLLKLFDDENIIPTG
ncbi:MAG: glutaredoxin [Rickettsiaceae bacterium]|nr:MAG: glutaredoxin [Rickettsiaceae bacterium]